MPEVKLVTARADFVKAMREIAIPAMRQLGFQDASFKGVFHGKDSQGVYFPMLRLQRGWIDIVNITISADVHSTPFIAVYSAILAQPDMTIEELREADVLALLMDPGAKTQYSVSRRRWEFLGGSGKRYSVKGKLPPAEMRLKVEAEIGRFLRDLAFLDNTRKRNLKKTGCYRVGLDGGELKLLDFLPKSSKELRGALG